MCGARNQGKGKKESVRDLSHVNMILPLVLYNIGFQMDIMDFIRIRQITIGKACS